eukprot:8165925-Alexandrium_andersonii.AAC.1
MSKTGGPAGSRVRRAGARTCASVWHTWVQQALNANAHREGSASVDSTSQREVGVKDTDAA